MLTQKAVVLLSGGIDSSVCLALAKDQGYTCYALSIDYKQRHSYELHCAKVIAGQLEVIEHRVIHCDLGVWGGSALTDHALRVDGHASGNVNTYVPARNTIFLSLAMGWAEALGAVNIFFAANAQDFDNYPDCRPEFFQSFTQTANLATRSGESGGQWQIHTPLLHWDKTRIIQEALRLKLDLSQTFSCYDPINYSQPCSQCLACKLRSQAIDSLY